MSPFFGPLARRGFVAPAAASPGVTLLTGAGHRDYTEVHRIEALSLCTRSTPMQPRKSAARLLTSCPVDVLDLGPGFVKEQLCRIRAEFERQFHLRSGLRQISFFKCDGQIVVDWQMD